MHLPGIRERSLRGGFALRNRHLDMTISGSGVVETTIASGNVTVYVPRECRLRVPFAMTRGIFSGGNATSPPRYLRDAHREFRTARIRRLFRSPFFVFSFSLRVLLFFSFYFFDSPRVSTPPPDEGGRDGHDSSAHGDT